MTKTTVIQIRVSEQEKAAIQTRAKKNGKRVGEFLRDLALQGVDVSQHTPSEDAAAIAGSPIGKDFTDEMAEVAKDDNRHLPTPEDVEKLAVRIHNTEGQTMLQARSIALARLTMRK